MIVEQAERNFDTEIIEAPLVTDIFRTENEFNSERLRRQRVKISNRK